MGKISDALKKVMAEREVKREREKEHVLEHIQKTTLSGTAKNDIKEHKTDMVKKKRKKLTLEEKLELKESLTVVKAKDTSGVDPHIVMYNGTISPIADQYRMLRTNIKSYLKKHAASPRLAMTNPIATAIFTFTSALHNEGKTLTSANCAVALAQDLEAKVLLIDGDLRKGSLHTLFNVPNEIGLSDLLANDFDYSVALTQTPVENLFLIPRGKTPRNPSELIGSRKMRFILEHLKEEPFTYVIIDTPPLTPFSDAAVMGVHTDGVILVVQANRTQREVIRKAKEFLEQTHNKLLGFVLNQVDHYASDMYGYYHYYYKEAVLKGHSE